MGKEKEGGRGGSTCVSTTRLTTELIDGVTLPLVIICRPPFMCSAGFRTVRELWSSLLPNVRALQGNIELGKHLTPRKMFAVASNWQGVGCLPGSSALQ